MMTRRLGSLPIWLISAAAIAFLLPATNACAQTTPGKPAQDGATPAKTAENATPQPDRALAYYHLALADSYEEEAATQGRAELVTRAIEEYKLALNADPASPQLIIKLADIYFRTGRSREAESTARELLKSAPDNIDAHKLLGRIYLRQLSNRQNAPSSTSTSENLLNQALAEYEKIVALNPKSIEDRVVLGQLYTVAHDSKKAEEQFKIAQATDPDSEDVVLNLARIYADNSDFEHEVKVILAVPANARTAKMEAALGSGYEQLKQIKEAIAAYQRAAVIEPENVRILAALAQMLLNDNQFDEALKQYQKLTVADQENAEALIHIGEIQRRQGKFEEALATIRKALKKNADNLEAGYNEGLLLDVLGRYNEAAQVFEKMVDLTSHANGAYTTEEKNNRGIFLERLGAVYHEMDKSDQAIAAYQKLIDMGGDSTVRGYQGQADTYRDAKQFDKAVEVTRKAVEASPNDRDLKLMLAGELTDIGKGDEGLALTKGLITNTAEDRTIWLALGQMCVRLRRWKEAEEAFNKADPLTTQKEDRSYLLFLRGELAERQKHYETAEHFFRQALELEPASAMVMNYLGYMMADKGLRLPEALKLIRKAVELDPTSGAYLDSLGWVYFKMGEYELAEQNLRQSVERDHADPTIHDHLGDLYEKTGRIRLAAAQWELSLAGYSKSAPADVEPGDVDKVRRKLEFARGKLAKQESATGTAKSE